MDGEDEPGKYEQIEKEFRPDPNDDRPLCKGSSSFTISEYADGEVPPSLETQPAQRVQRKPVLGTKGTTRSHQMPSSSSSSKEAGSKLDELSSSNSPMESQINSSSSHNSITTTDDRSIGSSNKFTVPEFAEESAGETSQVAKPRGPPKRFQKYMNEKNQKDQDKQSSQFDELIVEKDKTVTEGDAKEVPPRTEEVSSSSSSYPVGGFSDEMALNVGQKKTANSMMSEYPEGMDMESVLETAGKDEGPLVKRILSKVVKTRMQAFEELAKELASRAGDRELFHDFDHDWDKRVSDGNPGVQEQVCIALKQWIVNHPNGRGLKISDAPSIARALVEKCIAGGKPQVLIVSKEVILLVYERMGCEMSEMYDTLNGCVKNKNAKIVCAGIQVITDLLINYGPKKLEYMKPFFGEIEKQSVSTNSVIRQECMGFFKEAMKWLGDAIVKNYTKNLKKLQLEELDKFYADWDKQPMVPLRASEEEKKATLKAAGNSSSGAAGGGGQEIDLFEIAEAIDIFVKFNERWCDKLLGMAKWTEKKALLDEIIVAASQPKVVGAGFIPVVGMAKRLLNDANSVVQISAVKLLGCLAKSMRKGFSQGVKMLFYQILIRFREKKTINTEETKAAIDNFWYSVALEEVIEEIKEGLLDKAPPMKLQVMYAIERYFEARPNASKSRDAFKSTCLPTIKKLFDDSSSEVREYCLMLVGKLNRQKDWFTNAELDTLTAGLNEQKKMKIQRGGDASSATPTANNNGNSGSTGGSDSQSLQPPSRPNTATSIVSSATPRASRQTTPARGRQQQHNQEEEKNTAPTTTTTTTTVKGRAEKPQMGQMQPANTSGSNSANNGNDGSEDVNSSSIPNVDESQEKLRSCGMEEEQFKIIAGNKNVEKVELIQNLDEYFGKCLLELLVYLDKFAFKSSILTIQKEVIALVERATAHDRFTKQCFHVCSDLLIRNISDPKFQTVVAAIIQKSCEKLQPKYVVSRLIRVIKQDEKKGMPPKAVFELCRVITSLIDIASLRYFNVADVISFAKENVQNTNISIKSGGIEVLKKLYEHIGEQLQASYLKDIPLSIQGTITKEFSKIQVLSESEKSQRATMKLVGVTRGATGENKKENSYSISVNNSMTSILEQPSIQQMQQSRGDISKDVERLSKKLSDANWKLRKEAFDELDNILSKNNHRIQLTGLLDFLSQLKHSLNESNKGLQRQIFGFLGRFVEAVGKDIRQHSRQFINIVVQNLICKEPAMRKELITVLDRFERAIGGEQVINSMAGFLVEPNAEQRSGIIEWILRHQDSYVNADLNAFVVPILLCLDDKTKDVRVLAEQLLEKTIGILSAEPFKQANKDMKPATLKVIQPIIDKYAQQKGVTDDDANDEAARGGQRQQQARNLTNTMAIPTISVNTSNNGSRNNSKVNTGQSKTPVHSKTLNAQNLTILVNGNQGKTMQRNATAINLRNNVQDDTTTLSSNGGDRTPLKASHNGGLKHSLSSNKLAVAKQSQQESVQKQLGRASSISERPACLDTSSDLSQVSPIKHHLVEEVKRNASSNNLSVNCNASQVSSHNNLQQQTGGVCSWVDATARRVFMDDLMVFPLTSSISGLKTKRSAHPVQLSFNIVNPSNEHFEFVINELRFLMNPSVATLMFSFSYTCLIKATEAIKTACEDHMQVASLKYMSDLLLQWCFMRLYGNFNVEVCLHLLDTIRTILFALHKQKESLSDLEIGVVNAAIRECLMNLPESSNVFQEVYVIVNLQAKILGSGQSEKVMYFWLNQLKLTIGDVHPKYFELESLNKSTMQHEYINKLCELFSKSFLKDLNENNSAMILTFLKHIPVASARTTAFVAELRRRFSRDALLEAGFQASTLDAQTPDTLTNSSHQNYINNSRTEVQTPTTSAIEYAQSTPKKARDAIPQQLDALPPLDSRTVPQINLSDKSPPASPFKVAAISPIRGNQNSNNSSLLLSSSNNMNNSSVSMSSNNQQDTPFSKAIYYVVHDMSSDAKLDQLQIIHNVVFDFEKPENLQMVEANQENLMQMLYSQIKFVFDRKMNVQVAYQSAFLNVMYKCFFIKQFSKKCTFQQLKSFTEELLMRLLFEDEQEQPNNANNYSISNNGSTPSQQPNSSSTVRLLNSTMLRILENARQEVICTVLLELLIKFRQQANFTKIIGLTIKCLLKTMKGLPEFINQLNLKLILGYFHTYLVSFLLPTPKLTDDVGVKAIKTILKDLCQIKGEAIWSPYRQAIVESTTKDYFIHEWISLILKPVQQQLGYQNGANTPLFELNSKESKSSQYKQGVKDNNGGFSTTISQFSESSQGGEEHSVPQESVSGISGNGGVMKPHEYESLHNKLNEFKQRIVHKERTYGDFDNYSSTNN